MITYMDRAMYGSARGDIMASVGQPVDNMFYLLVAFQIAYALFEVPSGWLGDTFGPRSTLLRIVLWWSLFIAITAFAGLALPGSEVVVIGFALLIIVQFLFGMGEAGAFPNITRSLYNWFPASQRGSAQGTIWLSARFMGGLTPMIWVLLTDPAFGGLTWRQALWLFAGIACLWCAIFYWWFRNNPEEHASVNPAERQLIETNREIHADHSGVPWAKIINSRNLWLVCLAYMVTNFCWYYLMYYLAGDLKVQSLSYQVSEVALKKLGGMKAADGKLVPAEVVDKVRTLDSERELSAAELKDQLRNVLTASEFHNCKQQIHSALIAPASATPGRKLLVALIGGSPLLIGMIGCLVGGMLTDRYVRKTGDRKWGRRTYSMIGYGMAGVCYLAATYFIGNFWPFAICVMLVGFFNDLMMGSAWATCQDIGRRYAAIVSGCMNMIGNLGAAAGNLVTGLILKHYNADEAFGVTAVFTLYAGLYFAGALLWLKIDASKPIVEDAN